MNAKQEAIKQIQKEVMSSRDMMERFVEEIEDEHNLYCRAIDIAIKRITDDIEQWAKKYYGNNWHSDKALGDIKELKKILQYHLSTTPSKG